MHQPIGDLDERTILLECSMDAFVARATDGLSRRVSLGVRRALDRNRCARSARRAALDNLSTLRRLIERAANALDGAPAAIGAAEAPFTSAGRSRRATFARARANVACTATMSSRAHAFGARWFIARRAANVGYDSARNRPVQFRKRPGSFFSALERAQETR
jgi:hypothetical protein